jgi:hypothetical protein
MLSGLWLGILLGFAVITDYTLQNNQIPELNLKPDVRMERTVIYYDVFEFGEDGMRTITKDSIVYYDRVRKKRNK